MSHRRLVGPGRPSTASTAAATIVVLPAMIVAALLAGCGPAPGEASESDPTRSTNATAASDPTRLLGGWTLAETVDDDQAADSTVTFEPGTVSIQRSCGTISGSWRAASSGLFTAHLFSSSGCPLPATPGPAWLSNATSFRATADGIDLLDATGVPTARLVPARSAPSQPARTPGTGSSGRTTASGGDQIRLPAGLTPAGPAALVGRWVPDTGSGPAYLEFAADRSWRGSDGCNAHGGRWVTGETGALLAVAGASTLMGCAGTPVDAWLTRALAAGLDGTTLVLIGEQGKELGRLRRAS